MRCDAHDAAPRGRERSGVRCPVSGVEGLALLNAGSAYADRPDAARHHSHRTAPTPDGGRRTPDVPMIPLPVDALIPDVLAGLQSANALVLAAPPGSGKSTRVPPALAKALQASGGGKVYLLQPRRIAAKALAKR